jgi:hypothetical protein
VTESGAIENPDQCFDVGRLIVNHENSGRRAPGVATVQSVPVSRPRSKPPRRFARDPHVLPPRHRSVPVSARSAGPELLSAIGSLPYCFEWTS